MRTNPKRGKGESAHEELFSRPGYLIRRLHQLHTSMFLDKYSRFDITPVQYGILTILRDGAPLDQVRLGLELGVDRSTMSNVVARLIRRDLVRRKTNQADRRAKLVSITGAGKKLLDATDHLVKEVQDELLSALPRHERAQFIGNLRKLIEAANKSGRAELRLFKI